MRTHLCSVVATPPSCWTPVSIVWVTGVNTLYRNSCSTLPGMHRGSVVVDLQILGGASDEAPPQELAHKLVIQVHPMSKDQYRARDVY